MTLPWEQSNTITAASCVSFCTLSPSPALLGNSGPSSEIPHGHSAPFSSVFILHRSSLSFVPCFPEGPPLPEAKISKNILEVISFYSLYSPLPKKKKVSSDTERKTERKEKAVQCSLISRHPDPQGLCFAPCPGGSPWARQAVGDPGDCLLWTDTLHRWGSP